jgi:hypothetical protein
MAQYHYLDESGNWGFGEGEGVTRYLVLAMVQLASNSPLPALAAMRREFHLPDNFEIKYYRAKPKQKETFFKSINSLNFRIRAAVIDKTNLNQLFAHKSRQEFVADFISLLVLRTSELDIGNDILIIDAGSIAFCRAVRVKLSEGCRKLDRQRPFRKIVGGQSRNYDGLQLADMIAGAIMHYAMQQEEEFYLSFEKKIADLWWVQSDGT